MKPFLLSALLLALISASAQTAQTPPSAGPPPMKPRMSLTSTGFEDGGIIPFRYSMAVDGPPLSPRLTWTNVPDGTVTFAMILHDPDTSIQRSTDQWLHWLIFNIPATVRELPEGVPAQPTLPDGTIQGLNQAQKVGYIGMGAGAAGPYHHYTFEMFALDTKLSLGPDATSADLLKAMNGHILGKGVLVGRFHR